MHRRSTYFKKRQADFDPLSRFRHRRIGHFMSKKQGQNKNAENKLSRLVTDFSDYIGKITTPSYATVQALA